MRRDVGADHGIRYVLALNIMDIHMCRHTYEWDTVFEAIVAVAFPTEYV